MKIGFVFPTSQLHWWLGLAAIALAAVVLFLRWVDARHRARLDRFVEARLAPRLLRGHDPRLRRPLGWFTLVGTAALLVAFAQPRWGQVWQQVHRQSRDILVCLDLSESMLAENPLPNRLDRAKRKIESIMDRASGDRFGLVGFSGSAELFCPLTLDHGYFRAVLNAVDTRSISNKGTDIAASLLEAVQTFRDLEEETGDYNRDSRIILLISDGEQVSGDAIEAAEEASKSARVCVIGVGDPRGTEISYTDEFGRNIQLRSGSGPHLSKLDEETLQKIAIVGGGGYIRSTPDNSDIHMIYDLIEQLSTRFVSSDIRLQLVNRYQWPLAVAIFCFAAEGLWLVLLPHVEKRRSRKVLQAQGEELHA